MRAAAENLTPVTLELGGKSPAIVAPDANLDSAAADIAYGKFLNAGQTCIAPDYILIDAGHRDELVRRLRERIESYWPNAVANHEYTSVISERHSERLREYVAEASRAGAQIVTAGEPRDGRRMAPTLILEPLEHLRVMQDEIFGPVLPVVSYKSIDDAIQYVNDRPRPLALYLFTRSDSLVERVLRSTHSGGVCVNDTLVHIAAEDLPFGGIGPSGSGHYHGREGFDTFSKLKPVFRRRWPGLGRFTRPPYGRMHDLLKRILID
jgi:acyl-CoA reductase-like NAD-dependent aldehyde dehydrogenase